MLNDEKIIEIINEKKSENESTGEYFYGMVTASTKQMILLGSLSALANKYHILSITDQKIHIFDLDMMGNPKNHSYLMLEDVDNVQITNGMIAKKVKIRMKDGSEISLKAGNKVMGIKAQKDNLLKIKERFEN